MKTGDIKDYIGKLKIGPEEDISGQTDAFLKELCGEDLSDVSGVLDDLSLEISERLAQVTDENRAAELEGRLKFVEAAASALAELMKDDPADQKRQRSVLIADDSAERIEEAKRTIPVALDGTEKTESEKTASEKTVKENGKSALEKEAHELLERTKKEHKQAEKEEKQEEKKEEKKEENRAENGEDPVARAHHVAESIRNTFFDPSAPKHDLKEAGQLLSSGREIEARKAFEDLANGITGGKDMSKDDRITAMVKLADMLEKGQGGTTDKDKARFWYEKAAKENNYAALMRLGKYYAELQPSNNAENVANTEKSLDFFAKAVKKSDSKEAKLKYVEVCENKPISRGAVRLACKYLNELAGKERDLYSRKKTLERKDKVKQNQRIQALRMGGNPAGRGGDTAMIAVGAVGAVATVLADAGITASVQNLGFVEKFGTKTIEANIELLRPFEEFLIPNVLIWSLIMLALGRLLAGFENQYTQDEDDFAGKLFDIAFAVNLLTMIANVLMYVFPSGNMVYAYVSVGLALLMIAIEVVTRLIAWIALR